ncbi:DUF5988 family protein [Streptomyces laculatispora]|uniref:DUF5988 family protein n=1 Tax=Streptomyces laculatispora TaxID=887464 RepID=UPI001A949765|nr:DUF5988 family protein [Streptomyces laculatispora]MBO0913299.1 hypothetical protein [Streptomyces laculatispora]
MPQSIRVMLSGGPEESPSTWEVTSLKGETRVTVPRGNGYEHFEFADHYAEFGGELLPVYRWIYRTYIAE